MKKSQVVANNENALQVISENEAVVLMWEYYRDNKASLAANIREYRDFILQQLILGNPAASVFLPFTKT